jgi:hypothetical protein
MMALGKHDPICWVDFFQYLMCRGRYLDLKCKQMHIHTLWIFNIVIKNGPSIDGLAIKNGDFPW